MVQGLLGGCKGRFLLLGSVGYYSKCEHFTQRYMEATLNKNENYTWKFVKKPGNIMEFCHCGKMETLKVPFNWGPEHQSAFTQMKQEILSAPILAYYNPKKQNILQTDASIKGLGACLLQEEKPIYFESKALTETQQGYIAIELESLLVAWVMGRFHHFLYASHFILETD